MKILSTDFRKNFKIVPGCGTCNSGTGGSGGTTPPTIVQEIPITFTFSLTPTETGTYIRNEDIIDSPILTCKINSMGTATTIKLVSFYDKNGALLESVPGVTGVTTYTHTYDPDPAQVGDEKLYDDYEFSCKVVYTQSDGVTTKTTETKEAKYTFVEKIFYGTSDTGTISLHDDILALGNSVTTTNNEFTASISSFLNYAVIVTPFPLTEITENGINAITSFDHQYNPFLLTDGTQVYYHVYSRWCSITVDYKCK